MAFPRFLVAGALNTILTYILYLSVLTVVPYIYAYSLTYAFGIVLGYTLNALWVFKSAPCIRSVATYPLSYGFNYLLGLSLIWFFVDMANIQQEIAPLMVLAISAPIMYFVTKIIFQVKTSHEKTNN